MSENGIWILSKLLGWIYCFATKKKIFLGYEVPILTSPTLYSIAVFLQPCDPCLISTSEKVLQAGYWGLWGIKALATDVCTGTDCFANGETFMRSAATGSSFVSAATVKEWSDHTFNWVQMYEEQIIWHELTPLHFSHLVAPTCLLSQDIYHNPNILPYPVLQSYVPSSYNNLFLFQASVSCKTYLSNPIFPEFYAGHSHLQPQAHIPLSCFLAPPEVSHKHPAQQHHLEPSSTKSLDVRGSNTYRPAPTGTLRTSQSKGMSFN